MTSGNSKYFLNKTNNYVEYYQNNSSVLRRWYYRDNMWYEFYPDYSSSTLGKMMRTGRSNFKPLKPIKYYYTDEYGFQMCY